MRKRNYCFTYNYSDNENNGNIPFEPKDFITSSPDVRFAIWQLELAPETGRKHLQGYIEYTSPWRLARVKAHLGTRTHLEPRKGTRQQAIEYCRKEDSRLEGPWTIGSEGSSQGKRSDLDSIADDIKAGSTIFEIVESFPSHYIRYRRGIEAMLSLYTQRNTPTWRPLTVLVYYGEAGTGKTRQAIEESDSDFFILDQGERVWFDGYYGQSVLIIDDFYGWIKYGQLLRMLDGHPYRCEIKGGFVMAAWTRVVLTSNKHPREWYSNGLTPALERRITEIKHFE